MKKLAKLFLALIVVCFAFVGLIACEKKGTDPSESGIDEPVYDPTVPAHEHEYGEWVITKNPLCLESGERTRFCTICGYREKENVSALGHNFVGAACTRCGMLLSETDGLTFQLKEDHTYALTGYTGTATDVYVLSTHSGIAVTTIAATAFKANDTIQKITIVGGSNTALTIESGAMTDCSNLTSIFLSDNIVNINTDFNGDEKLSSIVVDANNAEFTSVDGALYNKDQTTLIKNPAGKKSLVLPEATVTARTNAFSENRTVHLTVTNEAQFALVNNISCGMILTFGDNVKTISSKSFRGNKNVLGLIIPNSITSIGESAFSSCSSLTSITLPDSVTIIGEDAFYNCSSLTSITIPASVTSIESSAFWCCYHLVEVYNKSSLNIEKGSSDYGDVGYYAKAIYTEEYTSKLSTDSNGYVIYTDGEDKILIGYTGEATELTLPEGITEINQGAFYENNKITSVTIDNSVTSIGYRAFYNCSSLTNITIPDSVTSIGDWAFYNCSSLTSITIGNSVTSIGWGAFNSCRRLTSITIPNSVTSIENYAFYECGSLTSITIPDSVTSIGDYAFYNCRSLQYNEYDNGYYLGNDNNPYIILVKAKNITSCTIHENTKFIHSYAFDGCSSLRSITIPDSVTSIGFSAFSGCSSLKSVYYMGDIASWCGITFGDWISNPLEKAHNLYINNEIISGEIVLPNTVTKIPGYTFRNSNITSITIPDSVTSIGYQAFYECSSLTSVKIGDSVTNIGSYAFYNCSSLTSVTIGDSVTNIGSYAFYECSSLTSITIPDSVTSIGERAFDYCSSLTSIAIPDSVTSIGKYAFWDCSSLTSVYYTGDIASWCGITFSGWISNPLYYAHNLYINNELIKDIVIPDTVTEIKDWVFCGWNGTSITIGNIVTSIGNYAFSNCSSLTSITIPDSVTSIGDYAFSGCTATIAWGKNPAITTIGTYAFSGYNGTSITILDSVTSIGEEAFSGCYHLVEVYNKSSLNIEKGSKENGYVGYYAKAIYTEEYTSKLSTDSNGYVIYTDGEEKSLIMYTGEETELTLPEGITEINQRAFYGNNKITSITIPDSVTSIGWGAFYECSSLTSITLGNSVTSIGDCAFEYCRSLTSITIPNSVTSIGNYTFSNCSSLTSITFGNSVTSIGERAFENCSSLTSVYYTGDIASWCGITLGYYYSSNPLYYAHNLYINNELIKEIVIPDTVTEIKAFAFYGWNGTSITIPDSVTSIGDVAFSSCRSLTSITIPDSVTSIGRGAFNNCSSLTSIILGNSVTSIGERAFENCSSLTSVYYTGDIASWCGITLGYYYSSNPLYYAQNLYIDNEIISGEIVLPNTVTKIPGYTFRNSQITSITIPDSVTSIGDSAFYNCPIETATIPTLAISYIPKSNLKTVVITSGESIGREAFYNCSGLTSITIPDSVTSIGYRAFYKCSSLTSVTIGNSVTSIGNEAFDDCSSLTSVYYTGDIASWCGITFDWRNSNPLYYAHNLYIDNELIKDIVIPDTVTKIKDYAFYGCSGLTSITIPDSVTSIGSSTFDKCRSLTSITFQGTKAQWNAIKYGGWNDTGRFTVHCTDGDI